MLSKPAVMACFTSWVCARPDYSGFLPAYHSHSCSNTLVTCGPVNEASCQSILSAPRTHRHMWTIYLPKWTTGFTSWVLLRWLQFPSLDFFSYLYDPSSNWSLTSFPDSAQAKFLLGMHRTVAVIWDLSSAFWYASFCVMEFIITMTHSNTLWPHS